MNEPFCYTAADWNALPPHETDLPTHPAEGIVLHHTTNPNRPAAIGEEEEAQAFAVCRQIQRDHFAREFVDTGQHFTLSRGGLILEGRQGTLAAARMGHVVRGAHAKSEGNWANERYFGIEIEGDCRETDAVTDAQFAALVELCAWLCFLGGFPVNLVPHSAVLPGHTTCPGRFAERIPSLVSHVQERLRLPETTAPGGRRE